MKITAMKGDGDTDVAVKVMMVVAVIYRIRIKCLHKTTKYENQGNIHAYHKKLSLFTHV